MTSNNLHSFVPFTQNKKRERERKKDKHGIDPVKVIMKFLSYF